MGACSFWRNCCCLAASKDADTEDKLETADKANDSKTKVDDTTVEDTTVEDTTVEDTTDVDPQPEKKLDDNNGRTNTFGGKGLRDTYKNFMQSETVLTISEGDYDVSQQDMALLENLIPDQAMLDENWTDSDSNSDASITTRLMRG
eukprot:CAMPEP_0201635418 /NCGR_PEP_ID=MMETSP0493-20130528/7966_1 /ASSEMBLY_ACC=CAM_ASM_000838 /TAXON_ID=420259 /ORGANISM="Thalassiosira gravida, Strain GMp14c1" /LENGTH=145 /DNA_ID=CAMNT_0048107385 /DNA_START=67 /DNA_END=504 /DNA_ORIENTATION=+